MKDKLKSDIMISFKGGNSKTQFVSFSLASRKGNPFTTKQNSSRQKGDIKFKTTKSSPEKNLQKAEKNQFIHKSQKARHSNEKIKQKIEISEMKEINPDDFMKKKLLKNKFENKTQSNYLNFTNPTNQGNNQKIENSSQKIRSPDGKAITPTSKSINNSTNKLNQTKNSGQFAQNSQQAEIQNAINSSNDKEKNSINTNITSSVASPRDLSAKAKQMSNINNNSVSSEVFHNKPRIASNNRLVSPGTGTSKVYYQNFNIKSGSKSINTNNINANANFNNNNNLIKSKISWQTTPVTNQNSRKTSTEKKSNQFPLKKNTILNNIGNHKINIFQNNINANNNNNNQILNIEDKHMPIKPILTTKVPPQYSTSSSVIITKKPTIEKKKNYVKNVLSTINAKPHLTTGNSPTHFQINYNKLYPQSGNHPHIQQKKNSNLSIGLSANNEKSKPNNSTSTSVVKNNNNNANSVLTINNSNTLIKGITKQMMSLKCSIKKTIFTSSNSKEVFEKVIREKNQPNTLPSKKQSLIHTPKEPLALKTNTQGIMTKESIKIGAISKNKKVTNKISVNNDTNANNSKDFNTQITNDHIINDSFELNNSLASMKSTIRDGTVYLRQAETLKTSLMQYYDKNNEYPKTKISFYKFGRLIGRGAFGKVNLGLHILTGRIVAIKSFNKKNLTSESAKSKIVHETNLMKNLRYSSIVKILETFETDKYILIIMENIAGGDLLSFVKKRTKLNEKIAKIIFKQLMEAIKYIHSYGVIHRDIKLDNILINLNNYIKLCDFGVGKAVKKGEILTDQCGTPAYIAPEILKNEGYEGPPVDLWSSGVVLYAMLSGTVPFKASNLNDLHKLILKGTFPAIPNISNEATSLLMSLLEIDPKKRITVDKVLSHSWLNGTLEDISNYKLTLFTKAEMVLLSKANIDYCKGNKEDLIEDFTIKNLDTLNDSENQNIATKSIILAPFNSSMDEVNPMRSNHLISELVIENDAVKLIGKVKELDRHYELNNNEEIDHEIVIKHSSEEAQINNNSCQNESFKVNLSNNNSPQALDFDDQRKCNIVDKNDNNDSHRNNNAKENALTNANTFTIDENVIRQVEALGYNREYVQRALINNDLNYSTATYYLLINAMLFE